ncbi:hypothetical protein HPB47_017564 [Ixodes persulcatus]|uniref:Uncharacterized protein n=1 Tax=Ixodes persulcatus TaxID=34615 RepID=A0AC60QPZ5_IXOPE|nr:hypothetical protein HPB47_017564 [Ixodes persulcatus]
MAAKSRKSRSWSRRRRQRQVAASGVGVPPPYRYKNGGKEQDCYTLMHTEGVEGDEITERLARKYLCRDPPVDQPDYEGEPNKVLDRPITLGELEAALAAMKNNSAPGPDMITARQLYNLDEGSLRELVRHFNEEYWRTGTTPES